MIIDYLFLIYPNEVEINILLTLKRLLFTLTFTLKSTTWEDQNPNYDKRDDSTFPIVNLIFISSNISASPAYGVYILQLIFLC